MKNFAVKAFKDLQRSNMISDQNDKRDTRSGIERRRFLYTAHIPERRRGKDRRIRKDQKEITGHRKSLDWKEKMGGRINFQSKLYVPWLTEPLPH